MKKKYYLELKAVGHDVISVIKTYRELTGLPLNEAKYKVEAAPCILLENFCLEEAERYKSELEACGATLYISEKKDKPFNKVVGKLLITIAVVIIAINFFCRVTDAIESKAYVQVTGTVTDTYTTSSWNAGKRSNNYHVLVDYQPVGWSGTSSVSEVHSSWTFSEGDAVPVLYQEHAIYKAYIAKKIG